MVPKDHFVLTGTTAEFTCCSDVQKLFFWEVKPIGSQSTVDINDISGLVNSFRKSGRLKVSNDNILGCYRLTITDVKLEDAGTYSCVDNEGFGQKTSWELVILSKNSKSRVISPSCSLSISMNWLLS